jgi:hypothetical protein
MVQQDTERRTADAPTEPVIRVPDVYERPGGLRESIAPWMIFFAVGVVAAVAVFAFVLSRGPSLERAPRTGEIDTQPAVDTFRTQTVNADGGIDVLALALSPGSLVTYHGAPITADGVTVSQIFPPDAFTVTSAAGAEMLVYVEPLGEPGPVSVTPGQRLTFLGTLMPVRPDFQFLVGPTAAPLAVPAGSYLSAVPQTISVIPG